MTRTLRSMHLWPFRAIMRKDYILGLALSASLGMSAGLTYLLKRQKLETRRQEVTSNYTMEKLGQLLAMVDQETLLMFQKECLDVDSSFFDIIDNSYSKEN